MFTPTRYNFINIYTNLLIKHLGEIIRLSDVLEKVQAELSQSKSQLSPMQRQEMAARSEILNSRELSKTKDEKRHELRVC